MMQDFGIFVTILVSTLSLILSIVNYWNIKPKLKIEIIDKKYDCFFGRAMLKEDTSKTNNICGALINIVNNSPVSITISDIYIEIEKEIFQLIDNKNDYWECVEFLYWDSKKGEFTTDGSAIYYKETGMQLPHKIDAYDTITAHVLFHNFPIKYKKKCRGKIILRTAIGKISKRVRLIEYDENYQNESVKWYLQYSRSLDEE